MQFSPKHLLVRASLVVILAIPQTMARANEDFISGLEAEAKAYAAEQAAAGTTVTRDIASEEKAPAVKTSQARFLSLAEAQAAFGPEFSLEDGKDGTFSLYGGTSENCMKSFDVRNDPKKGEFSINYKGDNDACLRFADAIKDLPKGSFRSLADLPDAKMKPEGTFDLVNLVSENAYSSKKPWNREELKSDVGASLSHVAAADVARKKKEEELAKRQEQSDMDLLLVTKCHRGLPELDLGSEALARLAKIDAVVKDKGDTWFADNAKKFRDETFKACRTQMTKARTDQIASAKCEDRLKKIAAEDDSYVAKIKSLYLDLVARYMGSTTMDLEEAYQAAVDTLAKIREYDISEDDERKLALAEKNIEITFLQRSALLGADSEAFKFMQGKFLDYLVENDANGCLNDSGALLPSQRMNRECSEMAMLSAQLGQQSVIAGGQQIALNKQSQDLADTQNCAALRASGVALPAGDEAKCKSIELAAAAKANAAANGSLAGAGDGFGAVVNKEATPATTTNSESGFLNSAYTAPSTTTPAAAQPAANVTTNAAPSAQRRVYR